MPAGPCVDDELIVAYFELRLSADESARLYAHVYECSRCAELMRDLARARSVSPVGQTAPATDAAATAMPLIAPAIPPRTIGRYTVTALVGMGGMGVVYAGHDRELDRKVAIKLLRPDAKGDVEALRARLMREAQAMARLSHPNVITVYEVGAVEGQVFIAMELVDGTTLTRRLGERPSQDEALQLLVAAGEGLAAAHGVGLVHRDFKPENVLVSRDGRVRVTDFGLARLVGEGDVAGTVEPASPLVADMTRTGALVGTPAYMAPEQLRREPTDPRSDIFSFCVTLYEALVGTRPFAGATVEERLLAIAAGKLDAPGFEALPRHLKRALARGLQAAPADRFASMRELLDELARDGRRLRRTLAAAAVVVALAAAAIVGWHRAVVAPRASCSGGEQAFGGAWDETRRAAVARAFAGTGAPFADAATAAVDRVLDDYRRRWIAEWRDACQATRVAGTQSEALLDLRMECLAERRQGVAALTDLFTRADTATVQRAVPAVETLDSLADCAKPAELRGELPPPNDSAKRAAIADLRRRLADVVAAERVGRISEALTAIGPIAIAAEKIGWPGLTAEVLADRGELEFRDDKPSAVARATLLAARDAAVAARRDILLTQILVLLVRACDDQHDKVALAEGHHWAQEATAWMARTGDDPALRARLLTGEGILDQDAGANRESMQFFERAVAASREAHDDFGLGQAVNGLGLARWDMGDLAGAARDLKQAVAAFERAVGPMHPATGTSLYVLGMLQPSIGELAESEANLRRAVDIRQRVLRPDHPGVCGAMGILALTLGREDKLDEAIATMRRSIDCNEGGQRTYAWVLLAQILVEHDRPADALRELEHETAPPGLDHDQRQAQLELARAEAEVALGRAQAALRDASAAHALALRVGPVLDGVVAEALVTKAEAELALHRRQDARASLAAAAVKLRNAPEVMAHARFAAAQASDDPAQGRQLAGEARALWLPLGPVGTRQAAKIDAWLRAH